MDGSDLIQRTSTGTANTHSIGGNANLFQLATSRFLCDCSAKLSPALRSSLSFIRQRR
jgi:hypothetical protein